MPTVILKHKNTLLLHNRRPIKKLKKTNKKVLLDKLNRLVIDESKTVKKTVRRAKANNELTPENKKKLEVYNKNLDEDRQDRRDRQDRQEVSDVLNDIVGKISTEGGCIKKRKKKYIQI